MTARRILLLSSLVLALLAGCDKTDPDFGDRGVVRVGIVPHQLLWANGASGIAILGTDPSSGRVQVAWSDADGRIDRTTTLPAGFGADDRLVGTLVDTGVRDPNLIPFVVGEPAGGASHEEVLVHAPGAPGFGQDGLLATGVSMQVRAVVSGAYVLGETKHWDQVIVGRQLDGSGIQGIHIVDGAVVSTWTDDVPLHVEAVAWSGRDLLITGAHGIPGNGRAPSEMDVAVLKVDVEGRRIERFGTDGLALMSTNRLDEPTAIAQQRDGRIVVAGETFAGDTWEGGRDHLQLVGLTAAGAPDPGFGLYARSIVDADSTTPPQLLAFGDGFVVATSEGGDVVTRRFDARGVLDAGWGVDGRQANDTGWAVDDVADLAPVAFGCLHRACNLGGRLIVAARTSTAPGGALVGLLR